MDGVTGSAAARLLHHGLASVDVDHDRQVLEGDGQPRRILREPVAQEVLEADTRANREARLDRDVEPRAGELDVRQRLRGSERFPRRGAAARGLHGDVGEAPPGRPLAPLELRHEANAVITDVHLAASCPLPVGEPM